MSRSLLRLRRTSFIVPIFNINNVDKIHKNIISNNNNNSLFNDTLRVQQRSVFIPPIEPLTFSSSSNDNNNNNNNNTEKFGTRSYQFPLKQNEGGLYHHGLTPEARAALAAAESQYKFSSNYLHALPGGVNISDKYINASGEEVTCIAAPFSEEYVPSHKERFSQRGHVGELSLQQNSLNSILAPKYTMNEHAQLNLRKERQLKELLNSPMPLLEKGMEVRRLLADFYEQKLAISTRNFETIIVMWSHCSVQQRLVGNNTPYQQLEENKKKQNKYQDQLNNETSSSSFSSMKKEIKNHNAFVSTIDNIPFLQDMRRLYLHARQMHIAPTPLILESIMTTLSALTEPDHKIFHLSNRLLLDADKYVILPTRTTYAAFFTICNIHNAMPFALSRFKDAVVNLHISVDASMATALLKGLSQNGFIEEALSLLARLEHVALDVQLLNTSLEVLLLTSQPQACFSAFNALKSAPIRPTSETYTILLLACEKTGMWDRATVILADMQQRKVKGDARTLNLLLKGLLMERLHSYARQLYETMIAKRVEVWPALESHMRPHRKQSEK